LAVRESMAAGRKDTMGFTHLDRKGRPRMVDVGDKPQSRRMARAEGFIRLQPETIRLIKHRRIGKGNVLVTAELAGVQAAKHTPALIPLCHPLLLSKIRVQVTLAAKGVSIATEVACTGQTGVEMEALTAASVGLLTVYDMCKAVDHRMVITKIRLLQKKKEPEG